MFDITDAKRLPVHFKFKIQLFLSSLVWWGGARHSFTLYISHENHVLRLISHFLYYLYRVRRITSQASRLVLSARYWVSISYMKSMLITGKDLIIIVYYFYTPQDVLFSLGIQTFIMAGEYFFWGRNVSCSNQFLILMDLDEFLPFPVYTGGLFFEVDCFHKFTCTSQACLIREKEVPTTEENIYSWTFGSIWNVWSNCFPIISIIK